MRKNEIVRLEITSADGMGNGVGRVEGRPVFVPGTAVGDQIECRILKALPAYAFGRIEQVLTPSPERADAACPVFLPCGGCAFQHVQYAAECRAKAERVEQAIRRIGGLEPEIRPLVPAVRQTGYRNKAMYPVGERGDELVAGFYAGRSHRIVPHGSCALQPPEFEAALEAVLTWAKENGCSAYNETTGQGLLRHVFMRKAQATGELMVVPVVNAASIPAQEALVQRLQKTLGPALKSVQYNVNRRRTNVVLGERSVVIFGAEAIIDVLCGLQLRVSPHTFYQVNRDMAERLYGLCADYAAPQGRTVLDLYCGAGSIGLSMAAKAERIVGVEVVPQAVTDARENAARNRITNAQFLCADAAQAAEQLSKAGLRPDVVIVDPPRKGCDSKVLEIIATRFQPARLVYVSCDPATLARDLKRLDALGYRAREATPVDLFPRTAHVETVVLLRREK